MKEMDILLLLLYWMDSPTNIPNLFILDKWMDR